MGALGPNTRTAGVYVPGTGTNLNGSETNYRAASNLAKATGGPIILYMGRGPTPGAVPRPLR